MTTQKTKTCRRANAEQALNTPPNQSNASAMVRQIHRDWLLNCLVFLTRPTNAPGLAGTLALVSARAGGAS